MATNKHAIIRYQTLDKCFRNTGRKYFVENLIEACNKSIYEFTGAEVGISKRQIFEDVKFMESLQGWSISLDRRKDGRKVYYRYTDSNFSINNLLLNEEEELKLKEVLLTLSRFKGLPQFGWVDEMMVRLQSSFPFKDNAEKVIDFEQNIYLKGLEFFSDFFNAIIYRNPLLITYKGFKQQKPQLMVFHPYYLKQYNNRWFVFGRVATNNTITNIALDRVQRLENSREQFIPNTLVNFEELFEDAIGVSIPVGSQPEKVLLKVSGYIFPYINTKPLHGSQKVKEKKDDYSVIELTVIINFELISLLLSFGNTVTVLSPFSLANTLKSKAGAIIRNYS